MHAVREYAESCRALLARFAKASRGTTAVTFAALAPFMLGAFGIASDSATFVMKRNSLQAIADSAALAAAKELAIASSGQQEIESVAKAAAATALGSNSPNAEVTVIVDRKASKVQIAVAETWRPFFAHLIKSDVTPIKTSATAMLAGMSNVCVLSLDPAKALGIEMTKTAKITANGCGVYANSNHAKAIELSDVSAITASLICSAGGVIGTGGAFEPTPTTDCPPVSDPLADRAPPSFGGCDHTGLSHKAGNHTFEPGVYCGGLSLAGTVTAEFNPGIYILKGGPLQISGQASIEGEHVGFYFEGVGAVLSINGRSAVNLTGPKDGPMAGLLFFEDRNAPTGRQHRIRSEYAKRLTGTIYLSRGYLLVDPDAQIAQNSEYTAIIVNRLEVREGPELILNTDYDATDVPAPQGIRAAAQVVLTK